jgi:PAS domain S-box-containing protein
MGTVQILVVEHQRREAGDLRRRLERLGYGVASVAATGRQAVEKARRSSPDLALMEIGLKGEPTGLEAAEEIRSRVGIPVIFLTDDAGSDVLARANITEPFGYVVKPVQDRELQLCIAAALQKHKADALDQAQKALARDRDLLHALMDNIPDAIYFKDAESRFLRVNKAHARRLGVGDPDEAVGRRDADFYADSFARLAYADEQEVVKSGRPMTDKVEQVVKLNGEAIWVSATKVPVLDAEGRVAGIVGISRDIRERKRAEEALRQTHQMLEALVNSAPLAICIMDPEGRVTVWNPAAERVFGWTREEVLGRVLPSVPADKLSEFAALRKRVLNGEALTGVELRRQRKDGTPIDISLSTAPLYDAEGEITGILGIQADITERKRADEELRLKAQLLDNANDSIFLHDLEGNFVYVNESACKHRGYTREELMALNLRQLDVPEYAQLIEPRIEALLRTGESTFESAHYRKDGTVLPVDVHVRVIESGGRRLFLSAARDITERKRAEEVLRESERHFREMLESLHLVAVMLDSQGRVTLCNDFLLQLTGWRREDVLGKDWFATFVPPEVRDEIKPIFHETIRSGYSPLYHENDVLTSRGERRLIAWNNTLLRDPQGRAIGSASIGEDITERRRAEQALRQSKELLEKTFLSQRDAIFILDAQTPPAVVDCNPAASEVFGYTRREMLGRPTAFLHADDLALREFQKIVYPAVAEHGFVHLPEFRMKRQDGTVFPTEHTVAPLTDELGNRIGWVSVVRDITERKQAEEALRESEERYRTLVEAAPDVIYAISADGLLTSLNPAFEVITGWPRAEWLGKPFESLVHPDDVARAVETFQKTLRGETPPPYELRIRSRSGEYLIGEFVSTPQIKGGQVVGELGIVRDITARKRAEEALRREHELTNRIMETSPVAITMVNREGQITFANSRAEQLFGLTREEVTGRTYNAAKWRITDDQGKPVPDEQLPFRRVMATGQSVRDVRHGIERPDGQRILLSINGEPLVNDAGQVNAVVFTIEDITERKRAEQALRQSEARFQELFDDAPVGYHELDPEGRITSVNRTELAMLGYTSGEMLGRTVWSFLADPETSQRAFRAKIAGTLPPGQAFERTFRRNDGRELPVLVSERLLRDPAGQIVGLRITNQDISERKRADEALREAMLRFELVIEKNPLVAIQGIDRSGVVLHWNAASEWLYGYRAAEVIGKRLQDYILPPEEIAGFEQDLAMIWESGEPAPPQEWPVRNRRGDLLWVYSTLFPIFEKGRVAEVFCMDVDVTQRRRAEEAEHHSRRVTEAVAAASLQYLETHDLQSMAQIIADRAAEITGAALGIVIDLDAQRRPRIRAASAATWGILDGAAYAQARRELDERGFYSLASFGDNLVLAPLRDGASLLTNAPARHPRWAGTMPAWHPAIESFLGVPIKTGDEVFGMIALANRPGGFTERELHDLETFARTAALALRMARSEEERARAEEQLHQAMKMEAIGRLAGGIAHDFNNLLTAIMGYAELGFNMLHPAERVRHYFEEIQQAADRASKLTRQLLTFSRRQQVQPRVINLNEIISDMGKMLSRLIGEDIELATRPADNVWSVRIDPSQIEQVLVNLAVNARDAMPHGGRLTVETTNVHLDEEEARLYAGVSPGDYVLLAVSDTGTGMTDEIKSHLFEPFFTTKEVGKGTGLGLATCYGIVQQSGGWIRVYSEAGQGTIFKIYFPRVPETAAELPSRDQAGFLPRGAETILLVEDESLVRSLAARILCDQGYTVLEAADGDEALRVVHDDPGRPIHLLMTDVVMPRMGGKALADRLRAVQPQLRVLFASGYSEGSIYDLGISEPGAGFLQKPFSPGGLARKVREVLDWPRVERRE